MKEAAWKSLLFAATVSLTAAAPAVPAVLVGVARVDITPELPIRLSGYQNRPGEATRADTRLYARALAIGADNAKPAVLITVELIGVGAKTSEQVAAALEAKHGIGRERVAVCATHVHSGPAVSDVLPYMFARDLPPQETKRIDEYTTTLRTKLVEVAEAALRDRRPGRLAWAEGRTDFAAQRRIVVDGKWTKFGVEPNGPVDHALPVLRATDANGRVRAVFVSYACHCTTVESSDNAVHHDWAGDAAQRVEAAHPGAVALVALGCGADANPNPRGMAAIASHGGKVAAEVKRLLARPMRELGPVTGAALRRIDLPLDHSVTRKELEERIAGASGEAAAYAPRKFLAALEAGQPAPRSVPYPLQAWTFGGELAMVFLAGEVVSEYSLRLRRELDSTRLWVNAYANSVPCYIASRRMYPEGGYEVDASMNYYGWPTRLAIGTEDLIIGTVHELVPATFRAGR